MEERVNPFRAFAIAVQPETSAVFTAAAASAAACAFVAAVAAMAAKLKFFSAFVMTRHLAASADFAAAAAFGIAHQNDALPRARFADVEASPKAAQNFSVPTSAGIAVLR